MTENLTITRPPQLIRADATAAGSECECFGFIMTVFTVNHSPAPFILTIHNISMSTLAGSIVKLTDTLLSSRYDLTHLTMIICMAPRILR